MHKVIASHWSISGQFTEATVQNVTCSVLLSVQVSSASMRRPCVDPGVDHLVYMPGSKANEVVPLALCYRPYTLISVRVL